MIFDMTTRNRVAEDRFQPRGLRDTILLIKFLFPPLLLSLVRFEMPRQRVFSRESTFGAIESSFAIDLLAKMLLDSCRLWMLCSNVAIAIPFESESLGAFTDSALDGTIVAFPMAPRFQVSIISLRIV